VICQSVVTEASLSGAAHPGCPGILLEPAAGRKRVTKRFRAISLAVLILVIALLAGSKLSSWLDFGFFGGSDYTEVGDTVVESVRRLSELTSVEMVEYTTIEKGNDYGWLNWARGDRIFMFAVARIGAGVDLSKLTPDSFSVNDDGEVTIYLPPAEILYQAIDNEATRVYDRDTGVFTSGDPRLESEARLAAEQILVGQAVEHGILDTAADNAATALREFLSGLGYESVRFVWNPAE
jgi:hypothetical protein